MYHDMHEIENIWENGKENGRSNVQKIWKESLELFGLLHLTKESGSLRHNTFAADNNLFQLHVVSYV